MTDMDIDVERLRELAEKAVAINSDTMLLDPRTVTALVEELAAARAVVNEANREHRRRMTYPEHLHCTTCEALRAYDRVRGNG